MSYDRATVIAEVQQFLSILNNQSQVQDVVVAGGCRRQDPTVDDVDIVVTAKEQHFPTVKQGIRDYGLANGWTLVEKISPYAITVEMSSGCPVDIRLTTLERRGARLLWLTGSISHNVKLARKAAELGYRLTRFGLFDSDGALIAANTEQDIFDALSEAVTPPEDRDR